MPLHPKNLPRSLIASSDTAGRADSEPLFGRLAVVGPGLLGGSVALAAAERGVCRKVSMWARRAEAVEELQEARAADVATTDLSLAVAGADVVVIATPVGAVEALLERILPELTEGCVVTDLCSVKSAVEAAAAKAFEGVVANGVEFVGAHPMAGSEQVGFEHARADLFEGAVCAICAGAASSDASAAKVAAFWKALGCRTVPMDPAEHDACVATISHLPHVAASALVNAALSEGGDAGRLAGPGFRDSTRIAMGAPEMWAEIVAENRTQVVAALERYVGQLGEVLAKLRDMDHEGVCRFLDDARRRRRELGSQPPGSV